MKTILIAIRFTVFTQTTVLYPTCIQGRGRTNTADFWCELLTKNCDAKVGASALHLYVAWQTSFKLKPVIYAMSKKGFT